MKSFTEIYAEKFGKSIEEFKSLLDDLPVKKEIQGDDNQVPFCPDNGLVSPNAFLRSALFGPIKRGNNERKALNRKRLWSHDHFTIEVSGVELDMNDFYIWTACVKVHDQSKFGEFQLSKVGDIIKELRWADEGWQRKAIEESILRLNSCTVIIKSKKDHYKYYGSLLNIKDGKFIEGTFGLQFNPAMIALFGSVTLIDKNLLSSFSRDSVRCLFLYLQSCESDGGMTYIKTETIRQLTRSNSVDKKIRYQSKKDLQELKEKQVIKDFKQDKKNDLFQIKYPKKTD